MEINKNTVEGKWSEIKGEIQKAWGKLTDDELEQTKGDMKAVQGLVQQKYGKMQDDFQQRWSEIVNRAGVKFDKAFEATKNSLKS